MDNAVPHLRICNWSEFQHYKHRNPPWIKLYRSLLTDSDLMRLQVASRWLAIGLLVLASETDNEIPEDVDWIKWRLRLTDEPDIGALVSIGFIERYGCASNVLAPRYQNAIPETETETETENTAGPLANGPDPVEAIVGIVSDMRESVGLAPLRGGDKAGRRYVSARIREHGADLVERVTRYAPSDPWISEHAEIALGPIFSPKSFPKLLARMESNGNGMSAGDRKVIAMRRRIYEQDGV